MKEIKDDNKFSQWYQQRFNSIVEQPPDEVWNNISNELDIKDVWGKVDSRLNSIERRKTFVRRSAYASILLLLLFTSGIAVFNTDKTNGNKIVLAEKQNEHIDAVSPTLLADDQVLPTKKMSRKLSNRRNTTIVALSPEQKNNSNSIFSAGRKNSNSKRNKQKLIATVNQATINNLSVDLGVVEKNEKAMDEIIAETIPTTLVSSSDQDFLTVKQNEIYSSSDSDYYSKSEGKYKFHGFYAGGIFSCENIWLLNRLTMDGLKSNSLNDTKIGFGYSYGVSAGYNFNNHFGGEANWYVNSLLGQSYNLYDEGHYVSRSILMDVSIVNLILKYRNQSYNSWLNITQSKNLLLGMNLLAMKHDISKTPPSDGDDDIDVYENINAHFAKRSVGVIIGYEYEILAFKKIIFSSAIIGNFGLTNMFEGNQYVPAHFNRTHAASLGINFGIKYLIK